jgi:30S ribosomal protein S31
MGKGDKKSKRGKIVIGSFGVRRARKKKKAEVVTIKKVKPAPVSEVEEPVSVPVKTAAKKTAKKAPEAVEVAPEKPKAPKTKKKAAPADAEAQPEEPKQE